MLTFEVTGDRSPKGEGNRQASEALLAGRPVDRMVCAQHGRDVMGWKSPVGVPTWIHHESMITTSRRQGQAREGLSGGSRSANVRGDGQKLHRRPGLRASWHLVAKPVGAADKVNAALVHGNIAFLPGEICRT